MLCMDLKQLFRVCGMASCEKRCSVELSIEKKKLVLDELGKGRSHRSIAADFGISKSTVGNIFKKREVVLRTWWTSANSNRIYRKRKSRRTTNEELSNISQGEYVTYVYAVGVVHVACMGSPMVKLRYRQAWLARCTYVLIAGTSFLLPCVIHPCGRKNVVIQSYQPRMKVTVYILHF